MKNWSQLTPEEIAAKPAHVRRQIESYLKQTPWTKADGGPSNGRLVRKGRATPRREPELTPRGMAGLCLANLPRD